MGAKRTEQKTIPNADIKKPVALSVGSVTPLPGDLMRIAEIAGTEAALKIAREFRGTTLYIQDVFKLYREEIIKMEYDGGERPKQLALKHRLSERTVWRILKRPLNPLPDIVRKLMDERR